MSLLEDFVLILVNDNCIQIHQLSKSSKRANWGIIQKIKTKMKGILVIKRKEAFILNYWNQLPIWD